MTCVCDVCVCDVCVCVTCVRVCERERGLTYFTKRQIFKAFKANYY